MLFTKMSGAGNLFAVTAAEDLPTGSDHVALAREVCEVQGPFGRLDGLIVVAPEAQDDRFSMAFYNPDGTSGMMCGNGARCAVRFAVNRGYVAAGRDLEFENFGTGYRGRLDGDVVRVAFPDPHAMHLDLDLSVAGEEWRLHFVDVGTPHLIRFLEGVPDELLELAIDEIGPLLRRHAYVGEQGANANFAAVDHASGNIGLRTFERGVEAETGACGTGAIATALAAASLYDLQSPITITPTSGEQLFVEFRRAEEGAFHDIVLGGPAVTLG